MDPSFKDESTAKASVSKIRNSSRSHAHKIQAEAVAMEQRAREMGKTSEAAILSKVYQLNEKKKTKKMNEEVKRDEYGDPIGGPKNLKETKSKKSFIKYS